MQVLEYEEVQVYMFAQFNSIFHNLIWTCLATLLMHLCGHYCDYGGDTVKWPTPWSRDLLKKLVVTHVFKKLIKWNCKTSLDKMDVQY